MMNLCITIGVVLYSLLTKGGAADGSLRPILTTWPPGNHFYPGEPIVLICQLDENSTVWNYSWHKDTFSKPVNQGHGHRVNHNRYLISAMTAQDVGKYSCTAWNNGTNSGSVSNLTSLSMATDLPPVSLEITPNSGQHLKGEHFSLNCSLWGSKNLVLWRLHNTKINSGCLKLDGTTSRERPEVCHFHNISIEMNGLYWCKSGDQRSRAIKITVSDSLLILLTPVQPMMAGHIVTLECKHLLNNLNQFVIYKNGVKLTNGPKRHFMTVTIGDEGFYKCINHKTVLEGPESWLSVIELGNHTSHTEEEKSATGTWVWLVCVIVVILLLIPAILLLVPNLRVKFFPARSPRGANAQQEMPQTKQDVTEIQWDLAWMEMANLLDKQQYPGS